MVNFKTVRPGDQNPYVELVQLALVRSGYLTGAIDGIYGGQTGRAITAFQGSSGLVADGIVGERTWSALYPYLVGYVKHRVVYGDTLYRLSVKYQTSLRQIEAANPDVDPFNLQVGSEITVPLSFSVVPTELRFTPTLLAICVEGLSARYPFLAVSSIGKSVMGQDITCLKIGTGLNEVFYNGSHHANEWITSLLLTKYVEEYCRAYAYSGKIFGENATGLYVLTTLYIVPMVNPDGVGLVTGELTEGGYFNDAVKISENYPSIPFPLGWKANIVGIDPNLQYPAGWENAKEIKFGQGYVSPAPRDFVGSMPLEAPEPKAVYDFTLSHDFSITISYHTQGRVIYWRYLEYLPPKSRDIAIIFGSVSGYSVEETPTASGYAGYKDWFILNYNRPGYTIEVGTGQSPVPLSQFPAIYNENIGILTLGLMVTA